MGYFVNNHEVTFEEIKENEGYRKAIEEENIEFDILITALINRDYSTLDYILDETVNEKPDIMEPILYSVKKEYGTYQVYKYYGESLQQDTYLAAEIIREEPEIFENTLASENPNFVLEMAEIEPKVVTVMSEYLKSNIEFSEELCELNNKEVTKYVVKECEMPEILINNPSLAENRMFMIEAVKQDPTTLEYASDELKNDYKFIKEVSKNKETIAYIVENTYNFGEKGLLGAKESLVEISSDEAISGFEEEKKKISKQIDEKIENNENNNELEELLKRNKQLERHAKFFERIKNGEIDPVRAAKMIDRVCVNLDESYREEIKQILKLDEAIIEKQKENKDKEDSNKKEGIEIKLENIENITETASLEGVKKETQSIREEVKNNRKTRENQIGEDINDKSNDERA